MLAVATLLTRLAFRSHYLYDIDSVNFALALRRFDPSAHQPHPPGYFLYVCLGQLANMIFSDANSALVAISIAFSSGAVAMIYVLADQWFGRSAALFAGLIFLFSPLAWFHGTVALTYIVEAFFSALVGYLCWLVQRGEARFVLPVAVILGIAAGFRPSSILLLGPLLLFSMRGTNRKLAAGGILALALTVLAWFIPMIWISGAGPYFSSLVSLWLTVPAEGTVFNSPVLNSIARGLVIAGIYFLFFGCAALLPLLRTRGAQTENRRKTIFTRFWIAPGLLFFTLVYLKFVNSGYLLILAPPLCAWMGLWAANCYANLRSPRVLNMFLVGGCAAINTVVFLYAPVYCSYGEVRRFETELGNVIAALPQIAPPEETMIVGMDSHFLGYRHAGYYLPGYLTVEFPEVQLRSGRRIFAMQDRGTRLEGRLSSSSARSFVIFPLPLGDKEYSEYMAQVLKRFPPGSLHSIIRGGHEFEIGPVEDLPYLFPASVFPPRAPVYGK